PAKTNHISIATELAIELEKRKLRNHKNFQAADWGKFRERLKGALNDVWRPMEIRSIGEFKQRWTQLEAVIQVVIKDDGIVPTPQPTLFCKTLLGGVLGFVALYSARQWIVASI
ncbi:hypothetical protein BDN71DRAFT_1398276, partial [Pleurotus eryngii]